MTHTKISDSAVRRLSIYLRLLRDLGDQGVVLVSSRELAERAGATSAQVRKDLSLFGSFGKRGRGYSVAELAGTLEEILGLRRHWRVALVGVGKIGTALLGYQDLNRRGFEVVAAFDTATGKVGDRQFGVRISPLSNLKAIVRERDVEIGIIATPPEAAQDVAERLAEAGVVAILNFAPVKLDVPAGVSLKTMDVAMELEGLSFQLAAGERDGRGTVNRAPGGVA